MKALITLAGRSKMVKARAGVAALPPITQIALGDGGVDENGNVLEPSDTLNHELIRRDVNSIVKVSETCYRFSLILTENELVDAEITEMALVDSEGDVVSVKNFKPKIKDEGMEMTFQMDDTF